jgi:YbgC/YbaW family acyl-CoA thioester hydrolase
VLDCFLSLWYLLSVYKYRSKIKLFDTDAAGILFFANQFKYVEEAYEAFLSSENMNIIDIIKNSDFLVPIVHAETDYISPLTVGDNITVEIGIGKIGESSFRLYHKIFKNGSIESGSGNTVHVCVSKTDFKRIKIPDKIVSVLKKL